MRTGLQRFDPYGGVDAEVGEAMRARILVVDDERGPRESLRMILSGSHDVRTAEDGASALEWLRTEPVDLVTVDLKMVEIIVITGCRSVEAAVEGIRHGVFDYLTKPFDVVQVTASVERALERRRSRLRMIHLLEGLGRVLGRQRDTGLVLEELEASTLAQDRLKSVLSELVRPSDADQAREDDETRATHFLEVLAETIESRDLHMRGHARRVSFFADLLAERLCLGRREREEVRLSAFLHDIGKVGAPRLLRPLGLGTPIARILRHHHERFDGKGYPDGLAGQDIPLAARVIAIADAFDAMTCEQPYRSARGRDEALAELRAEAGAQFDPELVRLFCSLVEGGAEPPLGRTSGVESADREADEALDQADRGAA
jgi:response regulator RpfG family c-di-GMP phosphodiesterase